ncbi:MAG: tetratricopeptide repeat protein [Myxococcota bacterium]
MLDATLDSRPLRRIVGIVGIALAVGAHGCTTRPTSTEPEKEIEEQPEVEQAVPEPGISGTESPPSVAVTTFTGPEGKAGWFGALAADHVTRRLHVASGNKAPPLYVFGWRQAMSAARSLDLLENEVDARAADLMVELGVDYLVTGAYTTDGEQIAIQWKIVGIDTPKSGEMQTSASQSAQGAYALGGEVLTALAPGVKVSDEGASSLTAGTAGREWGEALERLSRQSRDPRATLVLSGEEIAQTLSLLEKVTQAANDFAPAWAARAALSSMGDTPTEKIAMASAKAAINAGATDPTAAISLYYMHQQLGQQTKARELLQEALDTYPGSLEVKNYLAQAYYLASDYEKTLEVWKTYLEDVPKSTHAARRRDRMLARLGKHTEAVANAQALLDSHPKSIPTLAALASRQIDAGELDQAKATLKLGLEENPDHPVLLTRLSYVELESGSAKESLSLAKKAVARIGDGRGEPLAGYAHVNLARAQALSGDRKTAKKTLRKAIRLGIGGDDIVRLAEDPRLKGFIELPLNLPPEEP